MRTREFYIIWIICLIISLSLQFNTDYMLIGVFGTYTTYIIYKFYELISVKRKIKKGAVLFFKYKYATLIKFRDTLLIPGFFYTVAALVFWLFDISLKKAIIASTILPIAPYIAYWLIRVLFSTSTYGIFLYPEAIQFGFGEKKILFSAIRQFEVNDESVSFYTETKIHTHKLAKTDLTILNKKVSPNINSF